MTLTQLNKEISKLAKKHPRKKICLVRGCEDYGGPNGIVRQLRIVVEDKKGQCDELEIKISK